MGRVDLRQPLRTTVLRVINSAAKMVDVHSCAPCMVTDLLML